VVGESNEETVK
jgi:hypothetical protein